jgi:hypothetical protein
MDYPDFGAPVAGPEPPVPRVPLGPPVPPAPGVQGPPPVPGPAPIPPVMRPVPPPVSGQALQVDPNAGKVARNPAACCVCLAEGKGGLPDLPYELYFYQ